MDWTDFEEKRRKFLPEVQRASGKPTPYIEEYPTRDGEPMSALVFSAINSTTIWGMTHWCIALFITTPEIEPDSLALTFMWYWVCRWY